MTLRYTFFEISSHKGYILQVWEELLPRHWERQVWASANGTELGLMIRKHGHDEPEIDFRTTPRQQIESQQTWRERVRAEAHTAWEKYQKRRAERRAEAEAAARVITEATKGGSEWERKAAFGLDGRVGSVASVSARLQLPPDASSTSSTTETVPSSTGTSVEGFVDPGSETSGPTKPSIATSGTSTKVSHKRSRPTA